MVRLLSVWLFLFTHYFSLKQNLFLQSSIKRQSIIIRFRLVLLISATTKERLNNLESEKADIINKIAVEKARASLLIQKEDIVKYLQNAVKKRPLQMIQLIIKQVVLYNDKIEIHLNYTDGKRPDEENRRAFSFYSLTQRVKIDTHKIGRDPIVTNYKITLFI